MFTRRYCSIYVFLIVVIFFSGCAPPPPVQAPGIVETIVAATYDAAAAQTAAVMPSPTPIPLTPTLTKTPIPPTITPTPTPTFVVYLYSPTPTITLTPIPAEGDGGGGVATGPYVCQFISQRPDNGTTFAPKREFDWKWTVKNVGTKDWYTDTMTFMYISGNNFALKDVYQLGNRTLIGETEQLTVHMKAPKSPGTYTTTWAMRKGKYVFCYIQFQIVVR